MQQEGPFWIYIIGFHHEPSQEVTPMQKEEVSSSTNVGTILINFGTTK
jgi:hypothetical protein